MAQFEIIDFDTPKTEHTESKSKKGSKITQLFKKKPFLIACVIVAILGLYVWFRSSKSSGGVVYTDGSGVAMVTPTGAADTYTDSTSGYNEELIYSMYDAFNSQLANMQSVYDSSNDALTSQVTMLSARVSETENIVNEQAGTIQRQQDIATMMSNSDAYAYATTDQKRTALHDANVAIASKYGWTFDEGSGYWADENGNRLYQTVVQQNNSVNTVSSRPASSGNSSGLSSSGNGKTSSKSGSTSTASSTTSKESVINQMKQNSAAWNGASDSQKQSLHNANMNLASSIGLTFNSEGGYYTDSSGKRAY